MHILDEKNSRSLETRKYVKIILSLTVQNTRSNNFVLIDITECPRKMDGS